MRFWSGHRDGPTVPARLEPDRRPDIVVAIELCESASVAFPPDQGCLLASGEDFPLVLDHLPGTTPLTDHSLASPLDRRP
jgi:hypothetical protein